MLVSPLVGLSSGGLASPEVQHHRFEVLPLAKSSFDGLFTGRIRCFIHKTTSRRRLVPNSTTICTASRHHAHCGLMKDRTNSPACSISHPSEPSEISRLTGSVWLPHLPMLPVLVGQSAAHALQNIARLGCSDCNTSLAQACPAAVSNQNEFSKHVRVGVW